MLHLATFHNAHAQTSRRCLLQLWERVVYGCIANIFTKYLDFNVRWITTITSSFMLQRRPTTKLCHYLRWPALLSTSIDVNVVFAMT